MSKQLVLHSLSKKYNKSEKFANKNIKLTFFSGEISAITGHNGAGKTTMLNQVIGITKPSKGSITFNGKSFVTESKVAREYVSMMPQLHAPLNGVTMSQSIRSILRIRGLSEKEVKRETTKILKELAINDWKDTPGQKLSGGLRRLTSFAMTVAYPAPILLLDEPTNDVDPIRRQIIWKHLRKLAKSGHIIIVVTHNLLEVEKYADRYILMNNGKVLENKRLQERSLEVNRLNNLVGPNGAGKTTFMKCLCGLFRPDSGFLEIDNRKVATSDMDLLSTVGTNFVNSDSLRGFSLNEIYNDHIFYYSVKLPPTIEELINDVGLNVTKELHFNKMSLGMKQRFLLGMATIHNPSIILLDEPFNGLDPDGVDLFIRNIKELSEDRILIISSHVLRDLELFLDEIIFIDQGIVKESKSMIEIEQEYEKGLKEYYDEQKNRSFN